MMVGFLCFFFFFLGGGVFLGCFLGVFWVFFFVGINAGPLLSMGFTVLRSGLVGG